jgi:hypothetical protein
LVAHLLDKLVVDLDAPLTTLARGGALWNC